MVSLCPARPDATRSSGYKTLLRSARSAALLRAGFGGFFFAQIAFSFGSDRPTLGIRRKTRKIAMNEISTKTIRISCKVCAEEFDLTVALDFYEAVVAAAEEDGETVAFTG